MFFRFFLNFSLLWVKKEKEQEEQKKSKLIKKKSASGGPLFKASDLCVVVKLRRLPGNMRFLGRV